MGQNGLQKDPKGSKCGQKRVNLYQNALNWAEIVNRAGVLSAEGSQFQLHPSWSAGWTLPIEDLGKFNLEKAILGYLRPF